MKQTFVISAFPACGKSYCYNNHQDKYIMLDSDSSEFSWVKDNEGNNTKERNPEFPQNYMKHIKDNIGKVDIIFVSSHDVVRKALNDNGINTIIVYPNKKLKEEWIRRFRNRGNNDGFIEFISNNWDKLKQKLNKSDSYLDLNFLQGCYDNGMGCMTFMWANS